MTEESEEHISEAISELFGAAAAGLADYAKTLPTSLEKDERRRLLLEEARRQGLAGAGLLGVSFEGWQKENARDTFHRFIDERFAGHEDMNGREFAEAALAKLPWDQWLVDYAEECSRSRDGKPPQVGDSRGLGGAFTLNWQGKELPVVFAFATRYTPPWLVLWQFEKEMSRRFREPGRPSPRALALVGWYVRRRAQGRKHREVAAERAEAEFQGTAEWEHKKKRRRIITVAGDTLRTYKNRFLRYGTKKL